MLMAHPQVTPSVVKIKCWPTLAYVDQPVAAEECGGPAPECLASQIVCPDRAYTSITERAASYVADQTGANDHIIF